MSVMAGTGAVETIKLVLCARCPYIANSTLDKLLLLIKVPQHVTFIYIDTSTIKYFSSKHQSMRIQLCTYNYMYIHNYLHVF